MDSVHLSSAKTLVSGCVKRPEADIADDAGIGSLEGWDSIAHISIVLALEERIGRQLDSADIIAVTSIRNIADILRREDTT